MEPAQRGLVPIRRVIRKFGTNRRRSADNLAEVRHHALDYACERETSRVRTALVLGIRCALVAGVLGACSSGGDFTVESGSDANDAGTTSSGDGATGSGGTSSSASGSSNSTEASSGESNGNNGAGGEAGESGAGAATSSGGSGASGASGRSGTSGGMGGAGEPTPSGAPTVLLLLDGSSSMFEAMLWEPTYQGLMAPETGVIAAFQDRVRFGFMSFHGNASPTTDDDPACAMLYSSDFAFDNRDAIDAIYAPILASWEDASTTTKWETPTGHAVKLAAAALDMVDADGPKYIVLLTDNAPNTCQTLDPQCGQDAAIAAVQQAYALGITTLAVGIGDFAASEASCSVSLRCGLDYLQDLANAGVGQPVAPQPENYQYQPCIANESGILVAEYGEAGGSAPFPTAASAEELRAAMTELLESIL